MDLFFFRQNIIQSWKYKKQLEYSVIGPYEAVLQTVS